MPWIHIEFIADMEIKYLVYIPVVNLDLTETTDYYLDAGGDGLTWKMIVNKNNELASDCDPGLAYVNGETALGGLFAWANSDLGVEVQC
jgi:hypothetical protein